MAVMPRLCYICSVFASKHTYKQVVGCGIAAARGLENRCKYSKNIALDQMFIIYLTLKHTYKNGYGKSHKD